jgi:hypothetical protein
MTGDSEITGFIKKKGVDAAVKQFGQEAVDADGKLVGKKWVPNAAAPKSIDMTNPASSFETAQKESLEVAKQTQEQANARAAASEAAAKPAEEVAKPAATAATPAPRTLPANAPPVEQMRNLAEQWGVPHEGLSDLELFDAIDAKGAELRKTNGPTTFEAPAKPPIGTTIRQRRKPGDVVEGDNVPGEDGEVFPPIPDHMKDSAGELTTEVTPPPKGPAKLTPGTGRMSGVSSSTAAKPAPEGVVTSSNGKPRVVDGTKESKPVPPPAPAASTTHIPSVRARQVSDEPKFKEDADWMKPYVDEDGNTARLPTTDEDVVTFDPNLPEPPPGPTLIDRIIGPKDKRWGNVARIAGIAAVPPIAGMVLGERDAKTEPSSYNDAVFGDSSQDVPPRRQAPAPAPAPQESEPAAAGGSPEADYGESVFGEEAAAAAPQLGGADGEQLARAWAQTRSSDCPACSSRSLPPACTGTGSTAQRIERTRCPFLLPHTPAACRTI